MNSNEFLNVIKPAQGFLPLRDKYLMLSGVGIASVLIAKGIDSLETAPYAAYYVGAVNSAISPRFWDLMGVISLLLLCLTLPLTYAARFISKIESTALYVRKLTQALFYLTSDLGAVALGILLVLLFIPQESEYLQAWQSLLFSRSSVFSLLLFAFLNSILWLIGASLYNSSNSSYSGIVATLFAQPTKIILPSYLSLAVAVIYLAVSQQ
jgi:hypothetical protein